MSSVAPMNFGKDSPNPRTELARCYRCVRAQLGESVEQRNADLNLAHPLIKVAGRDTLAKIFQLLHLDFYQTAPVAATPSLPYTRSQTTGSPQGFTTDVRTSGDLFPELTVFAHENDRVRVERRNAGVTCHRALGPVVTGRRYDFGLRNMRQQVRRHERIADTVAGDAHRPYFQGLGINTQMHLAPLAPVRCPVFLPPAFAFADHLGTGNINQQMQPVPVLAVRNPDGQQSLQMARNRPIKSYQIQQADDQASPLTQRQAEQCIFYQPELAASENVVSHTRLPLPVTLSHVIAGLIHTDSRFHAGFMQQNLTYAQRNTTIK